MLRSRVQALQGPLKFLKFFKMKEIESYIKDGFSLRPTLNNTWMVYTPTAGNFVIESLDELTPERFDKAIDMFKNNTTQSGTLASMYQELTKEAPQPMRYEDAVDNRIRQEGY